MFLVADACHTQLSQCLSSTHQRHNIRKMNLGPNYVVEVSLLPDIVTLHQRSKTFKVRSFMFHLCLLGHATLALMAHILDAANDDLRP
jgi:hypothetical protein